MKEVKANCIKNDDFETQRTATENLIDFLNKYSKIAKREITNIWDFSMSC